jgi:hypothetical protein
VTSLYPKNGTLICIDFDGVLAPIPFFDPPVGDLYPFIFDPELHFFETPNSVTSVQSAELMESLKTLEAYSDIVFVSRAGRSVEAAKRLYGIQWPLLELSYRSREPKLDAIADYLKAVGEPIDKLVWVDDDENLAWPTQSELHEVLGTLGAPAPRESLILSPELEVGLTRAHFAEISKFIRL